ncbi:hypothetical protein DFA_06671 [Cavenderia fasciculata]|uniref:Uncharacterized protein n=1 Tax=Cavenderia fasciculata TaxID=261658 RepID=F4Q1Y5_CACFS|nr:uncharacterized protein DFA_06671 [Cavenderia fasciculata]EGG18005.1 hypothetical protein DFA_06671 [Cavenderia fasciculata]|eukprot:XP_004356898.1 hypothetical protein DFA_06671 [Cavenderia fasciculata]
MIFNSFSKLGFSLKQSTTTSSSSTILGQKPMMNYQSENSTTFARFTKPYWSNW